MWQIYQDSPEYGCEDNPSYKWYAYRSNDGHININIGPYDSKVECESAIKSKH